MELISKVSKGSRMDQIYIPKNRPGLESGSYVVVRPLDSGKILERPFFYGVDDIEPIKLEIAKRIFDIINKNIGSYENMIVTGSFLNKGFNFNDIDVLLVADNKIDKDNLRKIVEDGLKINIHLIVLDNKTLIKGLSTDPLYSMMLSRCISKKRIIYNVKQKINYKILDLHLLKSKTLVDNFDLLDGNEKYSLVRNIVAINLFLKKRKVNKGNVDNEIVKFFGLKDIKEIKNNMLNKNHFLRKYKNLYKVTFNKIMRGIKNGSKQE